MTVWKGNGNTKAPGLIHDNHGSLVFTPSVSKRGECFLSLILTHCPAGLKYWGDVFLKSQPKSISRVALSNGWLYVIRFIFQVIFKSTDNYHVWLKYI